MGENTNNLEMDLFDSNVELNLGPTIPEEFLEGSSNADGDTPPAGKSNTAAPDKGDIAAEDKNVKPSEGTEKPPESVAGDESASEEGSETNSTSPNLYSSIATVLKEQGLLPSLDVDNNNIESIDDFTEAFKKEIEEQKFNGLSDLQKEALQSFEKGIDVKAFVEYKENERQLDSISEEAIKEDVELAKTIIYQDLVNQGVAEKTATKIVQRTVDLGEESITSDALEAIENVKEFNREAFKLKQKELNDAKIAEAAAQDKYDTTLKDTINNTKYIIDNVPLDVTMKDKVYKSITSIVGRTEEGVPENALMKQRREDPIDFDTKLYYLFELTNGFKDFSKIASKSKSNAVKELENLIKTNPSLASGQAPDYISNEGSYFGQNDEIVL